MNKAFYPLVLASILAAGILLGYKIQNINNKKSDTVIYNSGNSKLDYILQLINAKYVDDVNIDSIYDGVISSMLEKLDPHSVYLPPVESQQEAEVMDGNFDGIGIEFMIMKDTVNVVNAIAGGPSEKLGISAGDKILKVDDSVFAGIGVTNEMVLKKLKGPKNTKVKVTMLKNNGKQITYTITRDKIPIYSVDAGIMLTKDIGYIKISRFAASTYTEFAKKLDDLEAKGMKKLILDLRGNGGGYMDQATKIADEFLDGKKLIVYSQGKSIPKTEEFAGKIGNFEDQPLVVLIDENSASASEIVSGALQDWDRATIIGRRSFGKGLVQEEIPFNDGSSLRLTVAKYYTPSGRSIQKPYDHNNLDYYSEVYQRYSANGELFNKDSIKENKNLQYKTKIKGRTVYGGGGITPDIFVALDTSYINPFISAIYSNNYLNEFSNNYSISNKKALLTTYKTAASYISQFNISDDLYDNFLDYCIKNGMDKNALSYKNSSKSFVSIRLKAVLGRYLFNDDTYYLVLAKTDKDIQAGIKALGQ